LRTGRGLDCEPELFYVPFHQASEGAPSVVVVGGARGAADSGDGAPGGGMKGRTCGLLTLRHHHRTRCRPLFYIHAPLSASVCLTFQCPAIQQTVHIARVGQPIRHLPHHKAAVGRAYVVSSLRRLLSEAGVPGNYAGHSFRRGAASSARAVGLSAGDIQLFGR
jgi:hypothetical protein